MTGVGSVSCTIGRNTPLTFPAQITALDNQFVTIALPVDCGPRLPEVLLSWSYDAYVEPSIGYLRNLPALTALQSLLFDPSQGANALEARFEPILPPSTPPEQDAALRKIIRNKVTMLWGPIRSGKSHLLALLAANYVKAGKSVLYVAAINEHVDDVLVRSVDIGRALGVDMKKLSASVGLPSVENFEPLRELSIEQIADALRLEKRKLFQERVKLMERYWATRLKQVLHEDHAAKLARLRELANERKREIDRLTSECNSLKESVNRLQSASMMDRLKKGFNKDELTDAKEQLQEKLSGLKHLQSSQTPLAAELLKVEASAPVHTEEWKEFQRSLKQIEEFGGVEAVEQSIADFCAVDEFSLLRAKKFLATTMMTALTDPRLKDSQFDLVMMDECESVQIPQFVALTAKASERVVVAGDPFQIGPLSVANTPAVHDWLQRDLFLHVSQRDELHRLPEWADQNSSWCIFLASHYSTTPKLSLFVASVLYDDRINVFTSPQAKGELFFIDTSPLHSVCRQYVGRKRMLPHNELHTAKVIELVKHVLMQPGRKAVEVGVVVPFAGPTIYTKEELRRHGLFNVEVGLPASFRGRRKPVMIFDTTVAGIDYTMRAIDDVKVGEHEIARLLNTVFSCVSEDLYVLADLSHFQRVYKDRLITRLLMLLKAQSGTVRDTATAAGQFDGLDWDKRKPLFEFYTKVGQLSGAPVVTSQSEKAMDAETALRLKMMTAKQKEARPAGEPGQMERQTFQAVLRVLGMMTGVNLLSQYTGGDILFHQSPETEEARARLPQDVVRSEREFSAAMDAWNHMLFEMSGGTRSDEALFAKNNPEARARWDVNTLKALYSPDIGALIEEGKQKIAVSASRVFQESIGKPMAANPVEWAKAYLHILSKMDSYLQWISQQLRQ